ncbi:hypothetical protein ABG067_003918 [Albugo candida]
MTIWLTVSTTTSCTNLYMARFRKRLEESRSRKSGRKKSTTGTCGTGLPRNVHSKRRLFGGNKKRPPKAKELTKEINYYDICQEEEDIADASLNWEGIGCATYFE